MRSRDLGVVSCLLTLLGTTSGCAAVFRSEKETVSFASVPTGAQVEIEEGQRRTELIAPGTAQLARKDATYVTIRSPGHQTHHGSVSKSVSIGWALADTLTCPITLCIPLMIDAFTGAWVDVEPTYERRLEPGTDPASPAPSFVPPSSPGDPNAPTPSTGPDISL